MNSDSKQPLKVPRVLPSCFSLLPYSTALGESYSQNTLYSFKHGMLQACLTKHFYGLEQIVPAIQ